MVTTKKGAPTVTASTPSSHSEGDASVGGGRARGQSAVRLPPVRARLRERSAAARDRADASTRAHSRNRQAEPPGRKASRSSRRPASHRRGAGPSEQPSAARERGASRRQRSRSRRTRAWPGGQSGQATARRRPWRQSGPQRHHRPAKPWTEPRLQRKGQVLHSHKPAETAARFSQICLIARPDARLAAPGNFQAGLVDRPSSLARPPQTRTTASRPYPADGRIGISRLLIRGTDPRERRHR